MSNAIKDNKIQEVKDSEIDFELPSFSRLNGSHTNVVPMYSNTQTARMFYGSRFANQAMPIEYREAPLVQALDPEDPDGRSFEEEYGERMGARYWRNDKPGEVVSVKPDEIRVKTADGKVEKVDLYNNFQFNRKTYLHNKPLVAKGDKINPGQLLASSNFTDDNGTMSMGRNARMALVAYKGYSMDDAVVVSESFAKKMTSQHNYEHEVAKDDGTKFGKVHFSSVFPRKFTKEQLEMVDDEGMVKPGTVLHYGDPIILATRPKPIYSNAEHLGKLGKAFRSIRSDASEVWEHDYPGTVVDVVDGKSGRRAFVTAKAPLQVGDKLITSRVGNKGIVSKIIPDHQILRSMDGKPFDVLLNPLSLPSRVNTATLFELALGKIAAKTGQPYKVPAFTDKGVSRLDMVKGELKKHGVDNTEEVYDPVLGRKLAQPVTTGFGYTYKLHHVVESKESSRGQGSYDQNMQPLKGGSDAAQAKRMGGLETTALMAKGGYNVIREGSTIKGTCFDSSTEVLTRRGWVKWGSVLPSDELYTKNKEKGGEAWYERPLQLVEKHYKGDLYGYEGKHLDWLVTDDHNLWGVPNLVSKTKPYYRLRTYKAASVYGKEGIVESFGAVYNGTIPDDYVLEFNGADGRSRSVKMTMYDYCEFMGWYLSEGFSSINEHGCGRVCISQDKVVNPDNFAEIEALLRRIGFNNIVYVKKCEQGADKDCIAVNGKSPVGTPVGLRVHSAPLAEHLLQFGDRAWLKRIPDIIFEASPKARIAFISAYIKGDGCVRTTNKPGKHCSSNAWIGSTSQYMVNGLQRLALVTGLGAWIGSEKKAGTNNYKHDFYRVIVSNNVTTQTFRKKPSTAYKGHYKIPYDGTVYCATMRTGLLYVRRNGKCMWSGNCNDDYWRLIREGYRPAEPGVPFVFTKYLALLNGAGMNARDLGKGTLRLEPMTDRTLEGRKPMEVKNNKTVKSDTLEPEEGGLFDPTMVALDRWGKITLPSKMPNPAMEGSICTVLGIREKDLRRVLAGDMTLKEAQEANHRK